jgi:iron(III) transport system substrate-binding protein
MVRNAAASLLCLGLFGAGMALAPNAQAADQTWLDKDLLAKAKAEGGNLIVYGSMNEEEALPFWKIFDQITGLKTVYVRASDVKLMARITVEARAGKAGWDLLQTTAVHKLPDEWLAQFDPPLAKELPAIAKDKDRRWYGVYANYNSPSFNTNLVKKEDLPKTYEDFLKRKEWKGRIAIDTADNEWLYGLVQHYGEEKAVKLLKDIQKTLDVRGVSGHGALARSTGAGEYAVSLNNYTNLAIRVGIRGNPIDWWVLDPVAVFYGQVGMSAKAPNKSAAMLGANFLISKEGQTQLAKSGRIPTRTDVTPNPPDVLERINTRKIIPAVLSDKDERKYQKLMDSIFGRGARR